MVALVRDRCARGSIIIIWLGMRKGKRAKLHPSERKVYLRYYTSVPSKRGRHRPEDFGWFANARCVAQKDPYAAAIPSTTVRQDKTSTNHFVSRPNHRINSIYQRSLSYAALPWFSLKTPNASTRNMTHYYVTLAWCAFHKDTVRLLSSNSILSFLQENRNIAQIKPMLYAVMLALSARLAPNAPRASTSSKSKPMLVIVFKPSTVPVEDGFTA